MCVYIDRAASNRRQSIYGGKKSKYLPRIYFGQISMDYLLKISLCYVVYLIIIKCWAIVMLAQLHALRFSEFYKCVHVNACLPLIMIIPIFFSLILFVSMVSSKEQLHYNNPNEQKNEQAKSSVHSSALYRLSIV